MDAALRPASGFDSDTLAAIFTAGYEGYWFPIVLDGPGFERMAHLANAELDLSRVAILDDAPIGVTLLARRGNHAWVGGMGVAVEHRRRGVGEAMLRAALDAGRAAGVTRVTLEVLEQNAPARALYERLGFEPVRVVEVWAQPGSSDAARTTIDVDVDRALAFVAAHRSADEPWQRADGSVARHRELGDPVEAVAVDGGGGWRAAAVYRPADGRRSVLQTAVSERAAATELVTAVGAGVESVVWLNLPADDPVRVAVAERAGEPAARQLELALEL